MIGPYLLDILFACFLAVVIGAPSFLYLRWYIPRRDRLESAKSQEKMERIGREDAFGVPPSPDDYHYAISFDSEGFTVKNLRSQKQEHVVRTWAGICLVTVFKRDLSAVDCICLHLGSADGTGIELDEEMAGWHGLLDALPTFLPGCKPRLEWYVSVVLPPFDSNMTEIYRREDNETA
jgi:hypothetical protein